MISNLVQLPYKIINVKGNNAKQFLQGQMTCDLESIDANNSSLGAYCTPQGRVSAIFRLSQLHEHHYLLRLPMDMADIICQELRPYAALSKVQIEVSDLLENINTHDVIEDVNVWNYSQINALIPEVYIQTKNMFLPHNINLHNLGAISFTKGCYRGQEIIARMQHLGSIKSALQNAYLEPYNNESIIPGDPVYLLNGADEAGDRVGTIVRYAADIKGNGLILMLELKLAALNKKLITKDGNLLVIPHFN